MNTLHLGSAGWGVLVGFVGWYSCFRLTEPFGHWLVPNASPNTFRRNVVSVLVLLFLLGSNLVALSLVPLIMCRGTCGPDDWRHVFGIGFVSSLLGFFAYGSLSLGSRRRDG